MLLTLHGAQVGVATHHAAASASYSTVVKLADNALYAAKLQGRNRCVCVKMHAPGVTPSLAAVQKNEMAAAEGSMISGP